MKFEFDSQFILDLPSGIADDRQKMDEIISVVDMKLNELDDVDVELIPAYYSTNPCNEKDKVRLKGIRTSVSASGSSAETVLREVLKTLCRVLVDIDQISQAKVRISAGSLTFWNGENYEIYEPDAWIRYDESKFYGGVSLELQLAGYLDRDRISLIADQEAFDSDETEEFINQIKGGSRREEVVEKINSERVRATFLFIRALQDYGNTTPSDVFITSLLEIYEKAPYLFDTRASAWDTLFKMESEQRNNILQLLLTDLSGLLRRSFKNVVSEWVGIIRFLRSWCEGDPRNFFRVVCGELDIDQDDPMALEKLQRQLERIDTSSDDWNHDMQLPFSYSKKIGRLLLTLMTENERGYDLMKGVSREQVNNLDLPVDAQIIRTSLNIGVVQVDSTISDTVSFDDISAQGVELQRSEFDAVCRRAWRLVGDKLDRSPVELDHILWSIGGTLGNRRGGLCFACPLGSICQAWNDKQSFEGGGSEWHRYGYSFARAHTDRDQLIILEDWSSKPVKGYSEDQEQIFIQDLDDLLFGS